MVHQPRILVAVALLQSVILTDLTKQRFHRLGYKPILKGLPEHLHIHPHVRAAFVADLLHLHDIQMFRIARKSKRDQNINKGQDGFPFLRIKMEPYIIGRKSHRFCGSKFLYKSTELAKEHGKLLPALCGVRHVRIIQVSHDLF